MNRYRITDTATNVYVDVFAPYEQAARNKGCVELGDAEWDEVSVELLHEGGHVVDIVWLTGFRKGAPDCRYVAIQDRSALELVYGVGSEWTVAETGSRYRVTAHPQE